MEKVQDIDHVTTGLRSLLAMPAMYIFFQRFIGGEQLLELVIMKNLNFKEGDRLLDMGCGPASILRALPKAIIYDGYDFNEEYINYARKKYKDKGSFYCKRVSEVLSTDNKYQIALASALLHHLNDLEAISLFNIAYKSLEPGGYLLTIDSVYHVGQSKLSKFIISYDRGQYVRTLEGYESLAKQYFTKVDIQIIEGWSKFLPYTLIVMKCHKPLNCIN